LQAALSLSDPNQSILEQLLPEESGLGRVIAADLAAF
jgi:hypothetical protein